MLTATALAHSATVKTDTDEGPFGSPGASRNVDLETWRASGVPLLRSPRHLVTRLHELHRPAPGTVVVAVLDDDERPVASASFTAPAAADGWSCRNVILQNLRRIVPDDLRRTSASRVTVLLVYRDGGRAWQPADGSWMWGFADACALHGLRTGAVTVVSHDGWQVAGDGRGGRGPSTAPVRERARRRPSRTSRRTRRRPAPASRPAATAIPGQAPVRVLPEPGRVTPVVPVPAPAADVPAQAGRPPASVPVPAAAAASAATAVAAAATAGRGPGVLGAGPALGTGPGLGSGPAIGAGPGLGAGPGIGSGTPLGSGGLGSGAVAAAPGGPWIPAGQLPHPRAEAPEVHIPEVHVPEVRVPDGAGSVARRGVVPGPAPRTA